MPGLKNVLQRTLGKFDLLVTRDSYMKRVLEQRDSAWNDIGLLLELSLQHPSALMDSFRKSTSQVRQDVFVLSELNFKKNGFFVEFGAASGIGLSNTYLLEKEFGWDGILAEPGKNWHEELKRNRHCHIETDCVWRDSGSTLTFNEVDAGEFSTIDAYSSSDDHKCDRKSGRTYNVHTISLEDMLDKYNAPKEIDYLSIDTEGSEYEILSTFNFAKYRFRVITCEHNFAPQREQISALLTSNGYVRKHPTLSRFDDWYVSSAH